MMSQKTTVIDCDSGHRIEKLRDRMELEAFLRQGLSSTTTEELQSPLGSHGDWKRSRYNPPFWRGLVDNKNNDAQVVYPSGQRSLPSSLSRVLPFVSNLDKFVGQRQ